MEPQDDGKAGRSARARSLMAAASLLGLSLGVGVAHAAESGAPAADASDQIKHAGASDDVAGGPRGNYIKIPINHGAAAASQIKGETAPADGSANFEKSHGGQAADRSSHYIKMDSSQMKMDSNQMKSESTDSASHQVKIKSQ